MGKNKEKYTDNSVLDVDFFREDINSMYDDVENLDELANTIYNDVKTIYFDKKKQSEGFMFSGKGTMPFVAEQMKTLATLRTGKANTMNQIIANKLKISQLALNKQKSNQLGDNATTAEISSIFKKLFSENINSTLTPAQQVKANAKVGQDENIDEILQERIQELENSGAIKFTANERAIKYEKDGYTFKVSITDGNMEFVPVNMTTGEIITDLPIELYPNKDTLLNAKIENNIVVTQDYNKYELV